MYMKTLLIALAAGIVFIIVAQTINHPFDPEINEIKAPAQIGNSLLLDGYEIASALTKFERGDEILTEQEVAIVISHLPGRIELFSPSYGGHFCYKGKGGGGRSCFPANRGIKDKQTGRIWQAGNYTPYSRANPNKKLHEGE